MCAVPCAVSCVGYDVVPCECYDVLRVVAVADTRSVATRGACIATRIASLQYRHGSVVIIYMNTKCNNYEN